SRNSRGSRDTFQKRHWLYGLLVHVRIQYPSNDFAICALSSSSPGLPSFSIELLFLCLSRLLVPRRLQNCIWIQLLLSLINSSLSLPYLVQCICFLHFTL